MSDWDTAAKDEVRVRFGQRDSQSVPLEWAETMLTELATSDPHRFGKLLQLAAVGLAPARRAAKGG